MDNPQMYLKPLAGGKFELLDGALLPLYGGSAAGLVLLTAGQYAEYAEKDNGMTLWQGGKFVFQTASVSPAEALAAARAAKLAEINAAAQAFIDAAAELDKVPDFEVKTWPKQGDEAEAWAADPAAATPMLDTIAAARGIERESLIKKALKKAREYRLLTAHVAGRRQAIEAAINAATTLDALDAIQIAYTAPTAPVAIDAAAAQPHDERAQNSAAIEADSGSAAIESSNGSAAIGD